MFNDPNHLGARSPSFRRPVPPRLPLPKRDRLPTFSIVLVNDDRHSASYIRTVLRDIFGYGTTRAGWLTVRTRLTGRCTVWRGHLEAAELKRERLHEFGPDLYAPEPVMFPLACEIEPSR